MGSGYYEVGIKGNSGRGGEVNSVKKFRLIKK